MTIRICLLTNHHFRMIKINIYRLLHLTLVFPYRFWASLTLAKTAENMFTDQKSPGAQSLKLANFCVMGVWSVVFFRQTFRSSETDCRVSCGDETLVAGSGITVVFKKFGQYRSCCDFLRISNISGTDCRLSSHQEITDCLLCFFTEMKLGLLVEHGKDTSEIC